MPSAAPGYRNTRAREDSADRHRSGGSAYRRASRRSGPLGGIPLHPEAQRLWAEAGFRSVLPEVVAEFAADFPQPQTLWTIDQIGGWATLDPLLFDPENGIVTKIFDQATA